MSFTYDLATDRGRVRLRLADTDATAYVFEDDEIDVFLSDGGSVAGGAIEGLRVLLVDRARRSRYFAVQGVTVDDRGATQSIREAIAVLGGLPVVSTTFPALLPMDAGYEAV